jgi:hypothetical protein
MTPIQSLRLSYRLGAALDAAATVQMLVPWVFGRSMAIPGFEPTLPYRFAMGMGASLMLGWTALLLWADRRPLERRGVLPLTVLVVAGLAANEVAGAAVGFLPAARVAPLLLVQVALATLFVGAWWRAGGPLAPRAPETPPLSHRGTGSGRGGAGEPGA